MTTNAGLPVAGYVPQSDDAVAIVNQNKAVEEYILRMVDGLSGDMGTMTVDGRWLSVARTHIEQGFMALNRAVFQPQRIAGDIALPTIPGANEKTSVTGTPQS